MYMNFRVPRQLKVHHQLKRFNIQTTRSNISRDQYTGATVSKTYQGLIAITLLQIAVLRQCTLLYFIQRVADSLAIFFGIAKHHACLLYTSDAADDQAPV